MTHRLGYRTATDEYTWTSFQNPGAYTTIFSKGTRVEHTARGRGDVSEPGSGRGHAAQDRELRLGQCGCVRLLYHRGSLLSGAVLAFRKNEHQSGFRATEIWGRKQAFDKGAPCRTSPALQALTG